MLIRSIQQACLLSTGAGQHTLLKRDADTAGGVLKAAREISPPSHQAYT